MARDKAYKAAEKKIAEARRTGATALNLGQMGLTELPESLGQLTQLQDLNVSHNQLTALPEWLGELTQLQTLNLGGNQLTSLPKSLGRITLLTHLYVGSNQLKSVPESLGRLTRLRTLFLGSNQLPALPDGIGELRALNTLLIDANQIVELPTSFVRLQTLETLDLGNTRFGGNPLGAVPAQLQHLTRLKELRLDHCEIRDLPHWLQQLEKLTKLGLDNNPLNPELAAAYKQGFDAVKEYLRAKAEASVVLNEAKLILIGEGEVGKSCLLDALRDEPWQEHVSTHGIEIKRVPITHRDDDGAETNITLNTWDFGGQKVYRPTHQLFFSAPAVYLVVWKPREGPQQGAVEYWINAITHRAGPDARVLVVATHGGPQERQPDIDQQDLRDKFGPDTILGFFHVDNRPPNYDEATDTWSGARKGMAELKHTIAGAAAALPQVGREVPASWPKVQTAIRERSKEDPYISYEQFQSLCGGQKVSHELAKTYAVMLNELGYVIHYGADDDLKEIMILKPDWLAKAISFVLDDKETRRRHGLISHDHLSQLWSNPPYEDEEGYPKDLYPLFRRLMERFDISYQVVLDPASIEPTATSLIAQLVDDRPLPLLDWLDHPHEGDQQRAQICQIVDKRSGKTASAEGLFYRLIARLHKYSLGRDDYTKSVHWQRGLMLDDGYNGRALLKHVGNDIHITVLAAYPEFLLYELTKEVKWLVENPHEGWAGLRCDVMVPCVEPCGLKEPGRGLFDVKKLMTAKSHQRDQYPCSASRCDGWQNIHVLLRNAPPASRALKSVMSHVFLSYVRQDAACVDELVGDLESYGLNVWLDRTAIMPGQRWKSAIRTAIRDGSFFVACFSSEYSDRRATYMNEELTLAIDELRKRPTDKSWFIPVKLSPCEIPNRDIGGGETLQDLQHIDFYEDWTGGFERLMSVLGPEVTVQSPDQYSDATKGLATVPREELLGKDVKGAAGFSLKAQFRRLMSQADERFANLLRTLTDEAKEGPRLFSFEAVDPGFWDKPNWVSQKFRLTLWCEHSRLPLPVLTGDEICGVYELELTRDWIKKSAPFLKVLSGTLSLALPIAASGAKLAMNAAGYEAIENQLNFGKACAESFLQAGDKVGDWPTSDDDTEVESGGGIRAEGATLRELHALLKAKDPADRFGGLVRVQNKRREFLWVHPQFKQEY